MSRSLKEYLRENMGIYIIISIIFAAGVIGGTLSVRWMNTDILGELSNNFSVFVQSIDKDSGIEYGTVFRESFLQNFKQIIFVFLAGLFMYGFLFIALLIGLRGFILGFTVGFLIENAGLNGIIFSMAVVAPHNIIMIPAFIVISVTGFTCSFLKFRQNHVVGRRNHTVPVKTLNYGKTMLALSLTVVIGIIIETYVSMLFIRITVPYFF